MTLKIEMNSANQIRRLLL